MSLRVAYMTGQYPRATDTFIQREVAALRRRGAHVETFAVRRPASNELVSAEQQAERDNTYYLLPGRPLAFLKAHLGLLAQSPRRYLFALRLAMRTRPPGLKALLWQLAYFAEAGLVASRMKAHDLPHLHNHFSDSSCSVAMLAAELGGLSFSFTMHGPGEFFEPQRWRLDEKVRRARLVCCISHFCRSQAMIFAPPDTWDRMNIVHCGIDPADYRPRHHAGIGRRVLFVGRLAAAKGLPILLDAIAALRREMPSIELTLAGDGPDRQRLEDQAARLGSAENLRFLGPGSQAKVRELLAQSDVFALASFAEGVPVVLMEAMAACVPVIATRIAGIPELVDDGACGLLVTPGDARALASAIVRLLSDPALRNRLGEAGREKVAGGFNLTTESEQLCEILTASVEGRMIDARAHVTAVQPAPAAPPRTPAAPIGAGT